MKEGNKTQYLAFDIYGTLLDTSAVALAIQTTLNTDEERAKAISSLWRRYQLEYTWRMNSMDLYEPFDVVTRRSLLHAGAELGFQIDAEQSTTLLTVYDHLQPFGDVSETLQVLSQLPNVKMIAFSNGTSSMVSAALGVSELSSMIPEAFLADSVRRYKPSPVIYEGLITHINKKETPPIPAQNVWLVSGNPFDITGARAAGLRAIWVDRSGSGWVDRLAPEGLELGPDQIMRGMNGIPEFVRHFA